MYVRVERMVRVGILLNIVKTIPNPAPSAPNPGRGQQKLDTCETRTYGCCGRLAKSEEMLFRDLEASTKKYIGFEIEIYPD